VKGSAVERELFRDLVVRQSPASKNVNTEVERSTLLVSDTRQRLVKLQQTEKALNWRVCDLATAL
jgi:hypothetical protein